MSTYVIGDVHGCFDQFIRLVKKIDYDSKQDQIILTGDLVNRGPKSLDVLNYCMADKNVTTVLGNHDLYLLYLISINQGKGKLKKIVEAENNKQIFEWLITRPLLIQAFNQSTNNKFIITHAGIPEIWSLEKAQDLAHEMRRAEQEEEQKRKDDAQFYCLVIGIPAIIIYGVLIYTYGG